MNIQSNDTLLAIYHLSNAQDKADAIDKLPDDATIPLEDVLVMTHKAVLLEVTDVRLGGYTAKSIPFRSDESAVEHAGGHLSVAVFTAEKASFKRYSGGRTFRHKWNYERRQYKGDSDTVDTWVSTSQRAKHQK